MRSHVCLGEIKLKSVTKLYNCKLSSWTDSLYFSKTLFILFANEGYACSIWTERKKRGTYQFMNAVKMFFEL